MCRFRLQLGCRIDSAIVVVTAAFAVVVLAAGTAGPYWWHAAGLHDSAMIRAEDIATKKQPAP
jgi:hypothetical protein